MNPINKHAISESPIQGIQTIATKRIMSSRSRIGKASLSVAIFTMGLPTDSGGQGPDAAHNCT